MFEYLTFKNLEIIKFIQSVNESEQTAYQIDFENASRYENDGRNDNHKNERTKNIYRLHE